MKICFLVDCYPTLPSFGGIATYVQTAARALGARGHEVHVLAMLRPHISSVPEPPFDTMDRTVHLHVRRSRWLPVAGKLFPGLGESLSAARAFYRLHRQFHFDVVEYPNWQGIGLVLGWLHPTRTVVRLYTSMIETLTASGQSPNFGDRYMTWAERASTRLADRVVTHSKAHRDQLLDPYGLDNIEVIPLGIPIPETFPAEIHDEDHPSVLWVGPLTARKGIQTFLKAAAQVLEKVPNAEFWVAGGKKNQPVIEKQFREEHPDLAEKVRFLGFVETDGLAALYRNCTLYASASVYESFGLTFVEAMVCGKAVVGCRGGAIPEIVEHEVNGLLVEPDDAPALAGAITRLLLDAGERRRFGEAGRRTVEEKFSAERMGEAIEHFLRGVCEEQTAIP